MAAGSAAIFFSSRMSPAAFTMHTLTVSRDTSRPAKYSIFLSLGCHTECQDSRLGSTARLLHGSAGLDWTAGFPITRRSRRTDTGAFARATCCAAFSRAWCSAVSPRAWSPPTGLRSTRVLIAADANKQRSIPSKDWKPEEIKENAVRAAREYLATLDNAAFGAASPVTPKFISRSDPAAQWTGAHKGHAFFAYAANYLIDTEHGVIVDVEATRAIRQAEVGAARTMLERTETRFGIKPVSLTADSAYGSADSLAWLVKEKDITPHIPVFDKSNRTDGTFSRADFTFDPQRDRYTCPAGKELVQFRRTYAIPRSGVTAEGTRLYRASKLDCDVCALKARCCPNAVARKIPRDLNEDSRDIARALASTPEYETACRRRKKIEMLFAHLKRILRLARLRLRGPNGAKDEFLLAATAQNLRRLARLRPINMLPQMLAA